MKNLAILSIALLGFTFGVAAQAQGDVAPVKDLNDSGMIIIKKHIKPGPFIKRDFKPAKKMKKRLYPVRHPLLR